LIDIEIQKALEAVEDVKAKRQRKGQDREPEK
jgi:hypothetical protein